LHQATVSAFIIYLGKILNTLVNAYQAMRVPEIWIYRDRQLTINRLEAESYQESNLSGIFPDLPIVMLIPELVQSAIERGTSQMLRGLRNRNNI
jgi:Uma2 family endonuclease